MIGKGLAWAATLAVALLAAGCGGNGEEGESAPPNPADRLTLFRFEKFTSAPRIDGGEVSLEALVGKVVVLDLFGTWCPPCRRSAPILVSLYERYHARGFEIVGLAYEPTGDPAQSKEAVAAFGKEFGIPYVLALGPKVVWAELRQKAGIQGAVPILLLMDRQGVVRDVFEGLPPGHEAALADRLERLLAEPGS
jgi:thiol-disulfide isomerase/thioredoxin